jgi:hypothetical protein
MNTPYFILDAPLNDPDMFHPIPFFIISNITEEILYCKCGCHANILIGLLYYINLILNLYLLFHQYTKKLKVKFPLCLHSPSAVKHPKTGI